MYDQVADWAADLDTPCTKLVQLFETELSWRAHTIAGMRTWRENTKIGTERAGNHRYARK